MNGDRNDEDIKAHFRDLRRTDEDLTPPFPGTWEAAVFRAGTSGSRPVPRLLTAGSALVLAGVSALVAVSIVRPPAGDSAMSQWRSPTAALLTFPGESVQGTVPRLGGPFPAITTVPSRKDGGAQ